MPTLDAVALVDRLPGSDDLAEALDARLAGGGVAATAAVAIARLGVPVAFVGRVGADGVGRQIKADLGREGVDVTGLHLGPGRSPLSVVLVERPTGARSLAPYPGAVDALELEAPDLAVCRAARWLHVGSSGYPAVVALRRAGITTPVSLDGGNPIPALDLSLVTLYAPTERALLARYGGDLGAAMRAALDEGPRMVVVTRGARGAVGAERVGDEVRSFEVPAFPVAVVSTLGAGDVFHGALLAELVRGGPLIDAVAAANVAAALSCRALDARSAIPHRDELDEALRARPHARTARRSVRMPSRPPWMADGPAARRRARP